MVFREHIDVGLVGEIDVRRELADEILLQVSKSHRSLVSIEANIVRPDNPADVGPYTMPIR